MNNITNDLCSYLNSNIYNEITMDELEKEFFYNKYYLIRSFKSNTGYTIKEYINTIKVLGTINPLILTNDSILKIALTNGFNSQEYYSEKFQDVIGKSPMKFRKDYRDIDEIDDIEELKRRKEYLIYLNDYKKQMLNITSQIGKIKKLEK